MTKSKDSEIKKITDSYNKAGIFLQAFVINELRKKNWIVNDIEYPVIVAPFVKNPRISYSGPRPITYTNGVDSKKFVEFLGDCQNRSQLTHTSIDVIGRKNGETVSIKLCIECEKIDPRYTEWGFFQHVKNIHSPQIITKYNQSKGFVRLIEVPPTENTGNSIFVDLNTFKDVNICPQTFADYGIGLKDNKEVAKEFYKHEKSDLDNACRQIICGTYGSILDSVISQILMGSDFESRGSTPTVYIPIIVTNTS